MNKSIYFVYILNCINGAYYTGYTTNLLRRFKEHCNGSIKCKFTRSFKPLEIAQSWQVMGNKGQAMQVERFIKGLNREAKTKLISQPETLLEKFPYLSIVNTKNA